MVFTHPYSAACSVTILLVENFNFLYCLGPFRNPSVKTKMCLRLHLLQGFLLVAFSCVVVHVIIEMRLPSDSRTLWP